MDVTLFILANILFITFSLSTKDIPSRLCQNIPQISGKSFDLNKFLTPTERSGYEFVNPGNIAVLKEKFLVAQFPGVISKLKNGPQFTVYDTHMISYQDYRLWQKIYKNQVDLDLSDNEGILFSICGQESEKAILNITIDTKTNVNENCHIMNSFKYLYNPTNGKYKFQISQTAKGLQLFEDHDSFLILRQFPNYLMMHLSRFIFAVKNVTFKPYVNLYLADCTEREVLGGGPEIIEDHRFRYGKKVYMHGRYLCMTVKNYGLYNIANRLLSTNTFYDDVPLYPVKNEIGALINILATLRGSLEVGSSENQEQIKPFKYASLILIKNVKRWSDYKIRIISGDEAVIEMRPNPTHDECYYQILNLVNGNIFTFNLHVNDAINSTQTSKGIRLEGKANGKALNYTYQNYVFYEAKCTKSKPTDKLFLVGPGLMLSLERTIMTCS